MEGGTHLMRMVQDMRSEINKLERENKALRGELSQLGNKPIPANDEETSGDNNYDHPAKEEVLSKGVLRRNASVGSTQILQEQKGVSMTVRRYSMSSSLLSNCGFQNVNIKRYSSSGSLNLNGSLQDIEPSNREHGGKHMESTGQMTSENVAIHDMPKTKSFQEYMNQCRGRVKAVTFLLPMDMREYAANQITIQGPTNQSTNPLSTIMEKDP
ncbi:coiled-coil domain-containing protein 195 [Pelodytes ibericus]